MNDARCKVLKAALAAQAEPQIAGIEQFFDGNDDLGSIGCNLTEHPGMAVFREVLTGLLRRPDVEAVYAQISELDPGEESWPFTDTVLVVGTISAEALREGVQVLQPDEVSAVENLEDYPAVAERHWSPVLVVWRD